MNMKIQQHIPLNTHTTFRIGGRANYFVEITTIQELKEAVDFAHKNNLTIFVLGGGSNVLISDKGFPGLVIKIELKGIEVKEEERKNNKEEKTEVISAAGEVWDDFVKYTVEKGLFGLENLSLIPGSVGAAPVQNIGAYGSEVKETISWVEAFDTETQKIKTFSNQECEFKYRDSVFKKPEYKKYIITRVAFSLNTAGKLNTEYRDVKNYIVEHAIPVSELSLQKVRDIVVDIRTKKLPDVKEVGTAGSFFKNPIIPKSHYEELQKQYPNIPGYPAEVTPSRFERESRPLGPEGVKVPAAWMLDNLCGFKGFRDGEVGVYKNQALVLVNFGSATFEQVNSLADKMIECVKEKTNIVLEKEVQIIS